MRILYKSRFPLVLLPFAFTLVEFENGGRMFVIHCHTHLHIPDTVYSLFHKAANCHKCALHNRTFVYSRLQFRASPVICTFLLLYYIHISSACDVPLVLLRYRFLLPFFSVLYCCCLCLCGVDYVRVTFLCISVPQQDLRETDL